MATITVTRPVSRSIAQCELTHLARAPIDFARAELGHAALERALRAAGGTIVHAARADELPDAVFIEDTAVVLDDVAIIARPGAESRRPEVSAVAGVLREYRELRTLEAPCTLDGGDVLLLGRTLCIGRSQRTNDAAISAVREFLSPFGYQVRPVDFNDCLHLKSAVTAVTEDAVVVNPAWVDGAVFKGFEVIDVDPTEPFAANVLRVGESVICSEQFPRTASRLARVASQIRPVDTTELAKAEGGVTCCALVFNAP